MRFGAILCPGNFRHGQALPRRLSLRAPMERKPVHDFLLPFYLPKMLCLREGFPSCVAIVAIVCDNCHDSPWQLSR